MSGTSSSAASAQNRTDTMVGAGMRVDGHIAFTGVLRIQGDVLGDVACQGDAGGTVVVDATGSVTGAVGAPRIVVRGRVLGPCIPRSRSTSSRAAASSATPFTGKSPSMPAASSRAR